jgi:hypothetical protein
MGERREWDKSTKGEKEKANGVRDEDTKENVLEV